MHLTLLIKYVKWIFSCVFFYIAFGCWYITKFVNMTSKGEHLNIFNFLWYRSDRHMYFAEMVIITSCFLAQCSSTYLQRTEKNWRIRYTSPSFENTLHQRSCDTLRVAYRWYSKEIYTNKIDYILHSTNFEKTITFDDVESLTETFSEITPHVRPVTFHSNSKHHLTGFELQKFLRNITFHLKPVYSM